MILALLIIANCRSYSGVIFWPELGINGHEMCRKNNSLCWFICLCNYLLIVTVYMLYYIDSNLETTSFYPVVDRIETFMVAIVYIYGCLCTLESLTTVKASWVRRFCLRNEKEGHIFRSQIRGLGQFGTCHVLGPLFQTCSEQFRTSLASESRGSDPHPRLHLTAPIYTWMNLICFCSTNNNLIC